MKQIHNAILMAIVFILAFMTVEIHKSRLDLVATRLRVDANIEVLRELMTAVNPKAGHWVCPAQGDRPEIDLGVPHPCDDGQCVDWKGQSLNQSAVVARCQSGKL